MDKLDPGRKEEIEIAKAKLDSTKRKIAETQATISKAEEERQEQLQQWNRKHKDLQSMEGAQLLKISKLNADLQNMKSALESRTEEHAHMLKMNAEYKEEMRALQDESVDIELRKKLSVVEDKLKKAYELLQNVKDAELLFDVGLGKLSEEEQVLFVEEMMRKRKQREEEINFQMEELDGAEKQLDIEIKSKEEQLALLKDRYISQRRIYDMSKKVKDARSKTLMKDKPQIEE